MSRLFPTPWFTKVCIVCDYVAQNANRVELIVRTRKLLQAVEKTSAELTNTEGGALIVSQLYRDMDSDDN